MNPRTTPATAFLRYFFLHTIQGKTCLVFSVLTFVSGIAAAAFPSWRLAGAAPLLLGAPVGLFLVAFSTSGLNRYQSSLGLAGLVALLGICPYVWPFIPDSVIAAYLPHPFLVASVALFGFGWWAFASERNRIKRPHPKTLRPVRLVAESVLAGLAAASLFIAIPIWAGGPVRLDPGWVSLMFVFGIATGVAYFAAPYMGYNLFWNARLFSAPALWFCLILGMCFLLLWLQAH